MKKLLSMILVLVMLVGGAGSALAAEENTGLNVTEEILMEETLDEGKAERPKVKELQGYDELLQLREQAKNLKTEIKDNNQQIKELRKTNKKDGLGDFKAQIDRLKQLKQERKDLRVTQKNNWQAMKTARQAKDQSQMQNIMNDILTTRQALNETLEQVVDLQEEILASLETGNAQVE
ncbi:MAG: hypothetical protein ACOY35_11395 [Bacillota bacterium]